MAPAAFRRAWSVWAVTLTVTAASGSYNSLNPLPAKLANQGGSGADWVVTSATTPERPERTAPGGEDATRPLGSRKVSLKFVVTKLDAFVGSRVVVDGLLIGEGGVDGINVTTVNRVAPKCP